MTACSLLLQVITEGSEVEKRKLGLSAPSHLPKELFKCCFGPLCQNGKNNFPEFRRKNIGGLEVHAPLLELGVYKQPLKIQKRNFNIIYFYGTELLNNPADILTQKLKQYIICKETYPSFISLKSFGHGLI